MTRRPTRRSPANEGERQEASLRVCAVGLRGLPGVMGGIEAHCEALYPRMIEQCRELEIVVLGRKPYLPGGPRLFRGIRIVPIWAWRNRAVEVVLHTLLGILHARFIAKADMVHIHSIGPGLLCPLARLLGMRVLFTYHGVNYHHDRWGPVAKAVLRLGERLSIAFADRVIVVGESLSRDLKARFPRRANSIVFVPNGMPDRSAGASGAPKDPVPSGAAVLKTFGLAAGDYILAVGRLVPEKGFQDLIAAYKAADLTRKLVIVGGADHEDRFCRELRAQASDSIVFTGFQSGAALDAIRGNAAVFVLPSHYEGMPMAALEAIGADLPVLLSDIAPNLDLGLPGDCYFPVGNIDALASRLRSSDFDACRCASRDVVAKYDWQTIAQTTAALCWEVAGGDGVVQSRRSS